MGEQTKSDIQKALDLTKNVVCIQLAAKATSPHDGFIYESNPCVIQELVNLGWTK